MPVQLFALKARYRHMPQTVYTIDLNADIGEGMATDDALLPVISSANIACGYHAGDADTMRKTIEGCLRHGVAVGAHPSYPDREYFGRRVLDMDDAMVAYHVMNQLQQCQLICEEMGAKLHHVKLHGALYNKASADAALAKTLLQTILAFNKDCKIYGLAGSIFIQTGNAMGAHMVAEFFADRHYEDDGSLVSRSSPDAMLTDSTRAAERAIFISRSRTLRSFTGRLLTYRPDEGPATLCLHGDSPMAVPFAATIRQRLEAAGVRVASPA